jgi:hypothetical protein
MVNEGQDTVRQRLWMVGQETAKSLCETILLASYAPPTVTCVLDTRICSRNNLPPFKLTAITQRETVAPLTLVQRFNIIRKYKRTIYLEHVLLCFYVSLRVIHYEEHVTMKLLRRKYVYQLWVNLDVDTWASGAFQNDLRFSCGAWRKNLILTPPPSPLPTSPSHPRNPILLGESWANVANR